MGKNEDNWLHDYEAWLRKPQVQSYGSGCEKMILAPLRELVDRHIPSRLYKLCPYKLNEDGISYAVENLKKGVVGMTSAIAFNDPFDTLQKLDLEYFAQGNSLEFTTRLLDLKYQIWKNPHLLDNYEDVLFKSLAKCLVDNVEQEHWTEEAFDFYRTHPERFNQLHRENFLREIQGTQRDIQAHTYVSCFTTEIRNMLMWSHYADCHKGFALGYDTTLHANRLSMEDVYPVAYSDKKIDVTLEIGFTADMMVNGDRNYSIDKLVGIKSSLFKSKDWSYEQEWRIVKRDINNTESFCTTPLLADAIYYGCRMSETVRTTLSKVAKSLGLKEYEIKIDITSDSYDLMAEEVKGE